MYVLAEFVGGVLSERSRRPLTPSPPSPRAQCSMVSCQAVSTSPRASSVRTRSAETDRRLGSGTTAVQGVFIEAFITCALCFVVLVVVRTALDVATLTRDPVADKSRLTPIGPVAIGPTLFAGQLYATI